MPSWIVTGGAGYIGAHVVRALLDAGLGAVALDNLSTGRRDFVAAGAPLVVADLLDGAAVESALRDHDAVGVIHCAGYKYAGESVKVPLHTYEQNVEGTRVLLAAMAAAGTSRLVFSSSAGVYGTPDVDQVSESTPCAPESPYGESKLIGEWLIRDQVRATAAADTPLRATSLRYFNVVGSGTPDIYDVSPHNLLPKVFQMLAEGKTPRINGDDYDTADGTCVRDYVDVTDLARSHVAAARKLDAGEALAPVYNLGSGDGTSVRQIMAAISRATGIDFTPEVGPRREGDPARIVANGDLAADQVDWKPTRSIDEMVASAWLAAPSAHPA